MRIILYWLLFPVLVNGQSYTSYFTGNLTDKLASPSGGICLMGGATEDDNAMRWFLQRAGGGDVLVLRASGADGYNDYLYSDLGISINSVETIVFNNAAASNNPYILQKIKQAEAVWFAGGDQWKYISYWQNTAVDSLINLAIKERNIVTGGTSAGMAIQGGYRFSAQNGTVTSGVALANPFDSKVTISSGVFLDNKFLGDVITDTHFDNPDRRGRLAVFLARIYNDYGVQGRAIACDEYTAVCIDTSGIARVFGGAPAFDDNAYFIQVNCEISQPAPENCTQGMPLTWNQNGRALKVCRIKGTPSGSGSLDLNDWKNNTEGGWFDWSVIEGTPNITLGDAPACFVSSVQVPDYETFGIYPNPSADQFTIRQQGIPNREATAYITDIHGRFIERIPLYSDETQIRTNFLVPGVYFLNIRTNNRVFHTKFTKN